MGDVLANLNYDFVYGLFTGIGLSFATWFVYKPDTIEHFVLSSLKPPTVPSPSTEPQQLSLPFDVPVAPDVLETTSRALLPSTPMPTNVTVTLAPTLVPRSIMPSSAPKKSAVRRGRPKKSTQTKKKTSPKASTRTTRSRKSSSRSTVAKLLRRFISIN